MGDNQLMVAISANDKIRHEDYKKGEATKE